jgi:hypothetical protein
MVDFYSDLSLTVNITPPNISYSLYVKRDTVSFDLYYASKIIYF